ncbi:MAG: nucleotidyltransferase domain-containing protein [Bacteroidaceae bacterium]|nr:nucleotidyltransferase domain-containing protein [Bacteroidaceae bacterium]
MKTESTREQIAKSIHAVLAGSDKPQARVILFGSRARGDAHAGSDWDLLILLDKEQITETDKGTISYPIRELGWDIDQMINPIMYTTRDWEAKKHTPFYKNVMKEGIIL